MFESWGVQEKPPTKSKKVVVAFPAPTEPNMVTITVHNQKSTDGKTLYRAEFKNA